MCDCELYLLTVHFRCKQISQNAPAAVELVEILPHSLVIQLRKSHQYQKKDLSHIKSKAENETGSQASESSPTETDMLF